MVNSSDSTGRPTVEMPSEYRVGHRGQINSDSQETYSSPSADPSTIKGDVSGDSPIGPVGLEAEREKQVEAVIARLSGSEGQLPRPFSEHELYRTAALVGVSVWNQDSKLRFRDRVLDRLNYQWDSTLELFVPIIGDDLVELLSTAAETITPALQADLSPEVQSQVDDWCDEHGFERLDDPDTVIARYAVSNCLLKATVYEQHHRHGDLPELPADIQHAFQVAREQTTTPAFDESVLDELAALADNSALESVLEQRHRLVVTEYPSEDIGWLFEALTPKEARQKLGQFRTPRDIGKLMRNWATDDDAQVLDPGMGACGLSAPSFTSWISSADPTHVAGFDRSHLGVVLGETVMSIHDQSRQFQERDFLSVTPDDVSDVDAVVCNPPYSRTQELSDEYTEKINRLAEEETGLELSGNAPLYSYFITHAAQFLSSGDRAAFLTPIFLDKGYGESLKEFLLGEFDLKALVLFNPAEVSVFDEAETTALMSFVEYCNDDSDREEKTQFIQVDDIPETSELRRAVNGELSGDTEWGCVTTVDQSALEPEQNWRGAFDPIDIDTDQLTPLSEIASVSRGILTGMNSIFCLSQSEVEAWGLSESYLSPIIRNASSVPHFDYRAEDWNQQRAGDEEVWLLYHLDEIDVPDSARDYASAATATPSENALGSDTVSSEETQKVLAYLEYKLDESISPPNRTFEKRGDSWYIVERSDPPTILVTTVNRDKCRFILNETDARNLNNLHGVFPDVPFSDGELKALLAYLNSTVVDKIIGEYERLHAKGMRKLEPGDVEEIPVLDPRELSEETVTALAEAFDTLRETARRDETTSPVIATIDEIVSQEL